MLKKILRTSAPGFTHTSITMEQHIHRPMRRPCSPPRSSSNATYDIRNTMRIGLNCDEIIWEPPSYRARSWRESGLSRNLFCFCQIERECTYRIRLYQILSSSEPHFNQVAGQGSQGRSIGLVAVRSIWIRSRPLERTQTRKFTGPSPFPTTPVEQQCLSCLFLLSSDSLGPGLNIFFFNYTVAIFLY
jgi:hypothetical protein